MILFLDFDGVIHRKGATTDQLFENTKLIWQLLEEYCDIQIVLSTSWREHFDFSELVDMCTADGGEHLAHRFISCTDLNKYEYRDLECKAWIKEHMPETSWLILDDDPSFFTSLENVLLINPNTGITDVDLTRIGTFNLKTDTQILSM